MGEQVPRPRPGPGVLAVIVSYNTRALTLEAIASVMQQRPAPRLVVVDNASADGSADAIAADWPDVDLIRAGSNLGYGRAVNLAVETGPSRWVLMLNPDARLDDGALARLVDFARANPGHGIYGGRTVFPDGTLNPHSCQNRMTPWSEFCMATGLTRAFRDTALFNPEGIGGWGRDSVREVDIVFGAFCLVDRSLWDDLDGFDPRYWLYGEDADLCLRATALTGSRPLFTPDAVATHVGGAASDSTLRYRTLIAKGRSTVMRQHWPARRRWLVRPLGIAWAGSRALAESGRHALKRAGAGAGERTEPDQRLWLTVWRTRSDWLRGYGTEPGRC